MTDYKPKVLMGIPVLYNGGTEEQMLTMITCLAEEYDTEVLCYFDTKKEMVQQLNDKNITTHILNLDPQSSKKVIINSIKLKLLEINPLFFHVQYIAPGLLPILAANKAKIKNIFATVHQPGTPYGWKPKLLIKYALFRCTQFICVSESVKSSWFPSLRKNHLKPIVIPNAIDLLNIEKLGKQLQSNPTKPYIMYAGRISIEKGTDILIKAFSMISKEHNLDLVIAGDGPEINKCKSIATEANIGNNIFWKGHIGKQELYKLMAKANLGIVPSHFEGFGLSALEFIANGTPVVAHNINGLPEIIKPKINGYLYNQNNPNTLADHINQHVNAKETMDINSIKDSIKKFDINIHKRSLLKLYKTYNDSI
ncbi:MAG: hypothetical protein COA79_15735 [Planctomycetota bacterium]|nr:MAG: hypothetical protein COA79_15735 [Planctomycetota bacterium]